MRRTRLWVGLPVLELETGERIGAVMDIVFDVEHQVKGLLVDKDGILAGTGYLSIQNMHAIGEDAIIIEAAAMLEPWEKLSDGAMDQLAESYLLHGERAWVGKELFSEEGTILGIVADVYIGAESDNIVGYEVSDGLVADLIAGRKWLPFIHTLQIGERILVKADAKLSELQPNA